MALKAATLRPSASAESLLDPVTRAALAPSSIASARSDKSVLSTELSAQESPSSSVNELQLTTSLSDLTCAAPPHPMLGAVCNVMHSCCTAAAPQTEQIRSASNAHRILALRVNKGIDNL